MLDGICTLTITYLISEDRVSGKRILLTVENESVTIHLTKEHFFHCEILILFGVAYRIYPVPALSAIFHIIIKMADRRKLTLHLMYGRKGMYGED
ncbi:MAG: hypothetical protein NC548_19730 [Lachnospiraceae bacterium]|nr:hypothetical protein [Lachnospiraceae bacterium]